MKLLPTFSFAAAAAVALYLPSLGLGLPEACAEPSPSCGGDLRECLRKSADIRQTTFGGRYVTAEDVARCMEGFDSCIHGGASAGGNGATPTSPKPASSRDRPPFKPFTMADSIAFDCTVSGDAVSCDITRRDQLPPTMDSWTAQFSGTLSGSTMSGTQITRTRSHYTAVPCTETSEGTEKVSMTFNSDGTAKVSSGGIQWHTDNCSESHDNSTPASEATVPWSLSK